LFDAVVPKPLGEADLPVLDDADRQADHILRAHQLVEPRFQAREIDIAGPGGHHRRHFGHLSLPAGRADAGAPAADPEPPKRTSPVAHKAAISRRKRPTPAATRFSNKLGFPSRRQVIVAT
jgi:hypothetical protein